jgi:hypothetical protein
MTEKSHNILTIFNPKIPDISRRVYLGDQADGIFSAASEFISLTDIRLKSPSGNIVPGTCYLSTVTFQVTNENQTYIVGEGDVLIYENNDVCH